MAASTAPRRAADDQREFFVRVAAELIAERGLEQATMREIAAQAGVSKGRIEHYFANKDEVLDLALAWANRRYLERQERRTAGKRGLEALAARLHCAFPLTPESRQEWRIRLQFWMRAGIVSPGLRQALGKRLELTRQYFATDLQEAMELGQLRAGVDPALMADQLMHLIAGVNCDALIDPRHYNRRYLLTLLENTIDNLRQPGG